jgi:ABC-2 type transport system permease protein
MLWQIFVFEITYRLRRKEVHLYFFSFFILFFFFFGVLSPPLAEKQFMNGSAFLAEFITIGSAFITIVSSAIMGVPLYRDIEHNTKEYYLSYPITKAGYFWGRFLGSFLFMILIGTAILWGAYLGTIIGPALGFVDAKRFGPNNFIYYIQPFLVLAVPNIFITSALFFGLVAITRNVKVIYSSGLILFFGYLISRVYFLRNTDETIVYLTDPFAINSIFRETDAFTVSQKNTSLISVHGLFLVNRILWFTVGATVLLLTYFRFNFENFFIGKPGKQQIDIPADQRTGHLTKPSVRTNFNLTYNYKNILSLVKIELLGILRDGFFWVIVLGVATFLGIIFWDGREHYGVPDFPRTVFLLFDALHPFVLLYVFFIIIFYTGEIVHKERITGFAAINDTLPPPNWVLYAAKLLSIFCFAMFLAILPLAVSFLNQIIKGFYDFNFPIYLSILTLLVVPKLTEMVMLSFVVHVVVNNKFAGHAVGIIIWLLIHVLFFSRYLDYNLLLFSFTPPFILSDLDKLGPGGLGVFWFNMYWLFFGGLLLVVAFLFYHRGTPSSFSERLELSVERFVRPVTLLALIFFLGFLGTGSFNYYNVSYINNYLTRTELEERDVAFEKALKKYDGLPLPKVVAVKLYVDLFPEKQYANTRGHVTLVNKTPKQISTLLVHGDNLPQYSLKSNGVDIHFTTPLLHTKGKFNFFRPNPDTSSYRLYKFERALAPGDTVVIDVTSRTEYVGFQNGLYGFDLFKNSIFFRGGLPDLGYDQDDELSRNDIREKYHLPEKDQSDIAQDDPWGTSTLSLGDVSDLASSDIIISTSSDQIAVTSGNLVKQWGTNNRRYFHYVQSRPPAYFSLAIFSGRYRVLHDTVRVNTDKIVDIDYYYHVSHKANVMRFLAAHKDGLHYYSSAYGPYPFSHVRLVESVFSPRSSTFPGLTSIDEWFAWNAHITNPNQLDYCYFLAAETLAHQWWGTLVAPNITVGAEVVADGLSKYAALILMEKKFGADIGKKMRAKVLEDFLSERFWQTRRNNELVKDHPLIKSAYDYEWNDKAGLVLFGLMDLIGETEMNLAMKEFRDDYAFRDRPPYSGSKDLFSYLHKHVPDSVQYYLTDTWMQVSFYDNKIIEATVTPTKVDDEYLVKIKLNVAKKYIINGKEEEAKQMNDLIYIGIFGPDLIVNENRVQSNPLYLRRHRLGQGEHSISITVKGKPISVGIDPYIMLIDEKTSDNIKEIGSVP